MSEIASRSANAAGRRRRLAAILATTALVALAPPNGVSAAGRVMTHDHPAAMGGETTDPSPTADSKYTALKARYTTPDVTLADSRGHPVRLAQLLAQPRPVLLQFIFTSCSTICPLLSATFSQAQTELDRLHDDYLMVSISIDPEYDTPKRLAAYARRYHAGPHWMFLSGHAGDVRSVMNAFDALYQSDNKMYHRPLFYLRARPGASWTRIEGFMKVADLVKEYRGALDAAGIAAR